MTEWGRNRFRKIRYSNDNSNENDESEINEKDEETGTLDDPMTNETKEIIVDWFMILKSIKMVTLKIFVTEKWWNIFQVTNNVPRQSFAR